MTYRDHETGHFDRHHVAVLSDQHGRSVCKYTGYVRYAFGSGHAADSPLIAPARLAKLTFLWWQTVKKTFAPKIGWCLTLTYNAEHYASKVMVGMETSHIRHVCWACRPRLNNFGMDFLLGQALYVNVRHHPKITPFSFSVLCLSLDYSRDYIQ